MIEFIAVVVIAGFLLNQSSRISRLEKLIKSGLTTKPAGSPETAASTPAQSAPAGMASVRTPAATVQSGTAPSNQAPVPAVSSEETSGRVLGGIGIAAVVIGISFFLKYAFDNNWIGPSGRVMIGILIGVVLLGIGQYLRKKYVSYSDLLMGGGIVVLYLSIFSAHFFYHLVTPTTAGVFMFIVTALSFAISIYNATVVLALVSTIGGFATPFLANSGTDTMLGLFAYITVLNLGILGISFFKKWPELIIAAFVGTLLNFSSWFGSYYTPAVLAPTLAFCFIAFLIFLVASVARATTAKVMADTPNYFLLGANALGLASIGYTLLNPQYHGVLGFAAVFVAIIYMVVAFIVNKANPADKTLNVFLPGLAVTFLSIAVPLQFSGPWIAVAWLVEAVVLYVIASFIGNRGFQIMGVVVYILGLINLFFWNYPQWNAANFVVFFNAHFLTLVVAVIAAYVITYMYYRFGSDTTETQKRGIVAFVLIANILTVYAFSSQIIFYHNALLAQQDVAYSASVQEARQYNTGYDTTGQSQQMAQAFSDQQQSTTNRSNTYVSIFWVIYAALLTAVGFGKRLATARRLGLALFIITACKVLLDVWNLGQIYRIVSFTVFGVVALAASFAYVRYKDRLKAIV